MIVHKEMNPNVGVLKLFPGITQATIKNFLQEPLEGIIISWFSSICVIFFKIRLRNGDIWIRQCS